MVFCILYKKKGVTLQKKRIRYEGRSEDLVESKIKCNFVEDINMAKKRHTLHNPDFNPLEFEGFRKEAGLNAFTLSPTRWIEATNAIGLVAKSGRYGGTYAMPDIAFKFANWVSVEFVATHRGVL